MTLSSGIATDELDPTIRPQDDLFRHVNGTWIARTEIPSDKARWGSFMELAEQSEAAVREIVEAASRRRRAPRSASSATCTPASSTRTASTRSA